MEIECDMCYGIFDIYKGQGIRDHVKDIAGEDAIVFLCMFCVEKLRRVRSGKTN